jgi:predicted pyridoxine 5'-phosphate oxidase superfamily flavin-nucleotide-binding protein
MLSSEMKKSVNQIIPAYIATVNSKGLPNVSAKGSFRALDDTHIAFADIASPRTVNNIRENNYVSVIFPGNESLGYCRIWGTGEIVNSGSIYDTFVQDFEKKNKKVNHVVIVTITDMEN